jgi:hypothetical protein
MAGGSILAFRGAPVFNRSPAITSGFRDPSSRSGTTAACLAMTLGGFYQLADHLTEQRVEFY